MKPVIIALIIGVVVVVMGGMMISTPTEKTDLNQIEKNDLEQLNETNSTNTDDSSWKQDIFPELYDENGERLVKYDETKIKVYVENLPEYSHDSITNQVIDDALASWMKVNPDLELALIDDIQLSNIDIKWVSNISVKPTGGYIVQVVPTDETNIMISLHTLGITETVTTYYENSETNHHEIQIDLSDTDCNNNRVFWNEETVTDTIKHEIGHTFGLNHSSDENNLMYDPNDGVKKILSYGLTIPQKISNPQYVGEKEVLEELEFYEDRFSKELGSHGWTVDDWESGKVVDNDSFIRRINSVIDNLNPVVEKYNCFISSK